MQIFILIVILVGMTGIWFSLMKSESYKIRSFGGLIFIAFSLFIYDMIRTAARSYEVGFYKMSLTQIRELLEKDNGEKAIQPIITFEENSSGDRWHSYPAVAQFYSHISKETESLNQAGDDNSE